MQNQTYDEFTTPIDDRYLEDYTEGARYSFGEESVNADEIMEFARRYDPQSIHTDPEAAAAGPFGGLIASGWQTAALMMRLFADNYLTSVASLASPASTSSGGSVRCGPTIASPSSARPPACARRGPSRTAGSSPPTSRWSTRTATRSSPPPR
ncbi:MaoC/PaaZ C-terminal domain-containing protein [Dietzia aerolata]|uniref:MaoC/PaaZ C-terminal domain-containing protein n=1 Tax=Dietzia aerolata TaxID=595984 RepID=UPI00363608D1